MTVPSASDSPKSEVALITSDVLLRSLATGLLRLNGHLTRCWPTLADAIAGANEDSCAVRLVLLDLNATDVDSAQIAALRNQGGKPLIIGICDQDDLSQKKRFMDIGCDGLLESPVQPASIETILQELAPQVRSEPAATSPLTAINLDVARKHVAGGDAQLLQLIEIMIGETGRFIEEIESGLESGSHADAERGAHSLKGAARVFGADEVADLAYQMEQSSRDQQLAQVAEQLPQLKQLALEMTDALRQASTELA